MANKEGRPKKYPNRIESNFSCSIPEHFQQTWKRIVKLSNIDINDELKRYCSGVEGENLDNKGQGKRSVYIRWVLTQHVIKNMHKLNG